MSPFVLQLFNTSRFLPSSFRAGEERARAALRGTAGATEGQPQNAKAFSFFFFFFKRP